MIVLIRASKMDKYSVFKCSQPLVKLMFKSHFLKKGQVQSSCFRKETEVA